ncbi:MAG TPA: erythromycin esterase family protein [Rudaea sp.]|nr:erythromycin esterase family protein [Rudaea sp.]
MKSILLLVLVQFGAATNGLAAPPSADPRELALSSVTHDLCKASVVFLGEPSHHGSTKSVQFKAALAERLVDRCHFDTIIFESPLYDLLDYNRTLASGQPVTRQMLLDGIGGVWSRVSVFQPFGNFLFERTSSHKLVVEGMDDQLSATGEFHQKRMPLELAGNLPGRQAESCRDALQTHVLWKYDQQHPYVISDKIQLLSCLDAIRTKLPAGATMQRAIVVSLARSISRDFDFANDPNGLMNSRDHSMFLNFEWLMSQMKPGRKVIVWAATVHLAKSPDVNSPMQAAWHSFGWRVAREMKIHPVTIGFSALDGSFGRHQPQPLPIAPNDSLEARAFAGTSKDVVYENKASLKRAGEIAARAYASAFETAEWADVIDGLVIFRHDEPITLIPQNVSR